MVKAKSPPDTVMTIEELSQYLKISRSTLYKLAQEGTCRPRKLGGTGASTGTPWTRG